MGYCTETSILPPLHEHCAFSAFFSITQHTQRTTRTHTPHKPRARHAQLEAKTLRYLSSDQALADNAELVTDLKRELSAEHAPVVVFGGSYGGMLASWMRMK